MKKRRKAMSDLFGLERPHKISDGDEVSHLITVYDVAVLGIVRGMLEDENIPYLVRERGTGSAMRILTGFSLYGTDVYVPSEALDTAKGLVAGLEDAEITFVDDEGNEISVDEAAEDAAEDGADTEDE
jgi:hypothetical protein